MTREEAIAIMQVYKEKLEHRIAKIDYDVEAIDLYSIQIEAYDMAISALSADGEKTCRTCAYRATCVMSVPDGNWKACDDYEPQDGDLISRADAMGTVQDHFNDDGFKGYDDGQKMLDRIKALPSAELPLANLKQEFESAEAVQGEWIEHKDCEGKTRTITCSRCGYTERSWVNMNFCPNCGARMKGGDDE